ncbi:NAD-dependent glutamate dehydrogenase [Rhodococcus sp. AW25M09]|uniref:NAD-glutamate dehydrogenase n=1 Tax=Rhodococcus sp. AW25M09 TaxID=1268303 RepID=UPI0002ACA3F2|nr:NAD-glutamate dehydrogenase [Rhodococcus sp. AW25M09]CCQ15947.1 NAD-dependent glutamate dehydrogenase [Rhodococcus sp. AW25M09]
MPRSLDLTDNDWADGLDDRLLAELDTLRAEYFEHVDTTAAGASAHAPDITSFRRHVRLAAQRSPETANVAVHRPSETGPAADQAAGSYLQIVTDDMPLLVESIISLLSRIGIEYTDVVHPILSVGRDADGVLTGPRTGGSDESWIHVQLHPSTTDDAAGRLQSEASRVLADVRQVVGDTDRMRRVQAEVADRLDQFARGTSDPDSDSAREHRDAAALLRWLGDGHYTLLGYRRYSIDGIGGEQRVTGERSSSLGVLRDSGQAVDGSEPVGQRDLVALTQGSSPATVHRAVYPYFVSVLDAADSAEHRFVGVFTVTALHENVLDIPVIERRVRSVLARAGHDLGSFSGQAMLEVLQSMPRSELFATSASWLFETASAVLALGRRRKVKLFVRPDASGSFVSALVYLPRDRYTTRVRLAIQDRLLGELGGTSLDYTARVTESDLALLHVTVRRTPGTAATELSDEDIARIEASLTETTRTWEDSLGDAVSLDRAVDPVRIQRYTDAFPEAYKQDFGPARAVTDIARLEALDDESIDMQLYRNEQSAVGSWRFSLYIGGAGVSLSQVLPILQSLGVEVDDERPYPVVRPDGMSCWIYDFGLSASREMLSSAIDGDIDAELSEAGTADRESRVQQRFTDAFAAVWSGQAEADRFNELVMRAGLHWRQAVVLRAYAKYLRQAGFPYSQFNIEGVLLTHPRTARLLVGLFEAQFDPEASSEENAHAIGTELDELIDQVVSLDADRTLRSIFELIRATLRTNFFVLGPDGERREYLSLKFDPQSIAELPKPKPKFEIFVYSPRVEGVHLRFGAVARGGLRWSDRREDFRTEILGLAKAQMVKNSVIVPVGAKGGFVVKRPPVATGDADRDRQAFAEEGKACYRLFIAGLLDITDNLDRATGSVSVPAGVVRRDGDDTYLVVAADKGTATFSDMANDVAAQYGFWLGDAFASGGSAGYDHKAMGITAKGAWESVKRHFREIGIDTQSEDFTVVGVGDMSGDVFGNGMLLSRHIRLLAAFDHRHIFLDPDPERESSFAERERLFALPRSSWADYDTSLISAGGGVWERTRKSVPISAAARAALGLADSVEALSPPELVNAILKAPADLLWNGGIGTYIKASTESNAEVGDKANDAVRVDGGAVRAAVVGEGGNLGATALGRIEYATAGGKINTDAIDNSAGVDCSDHEVNIKILLETAITNGNLAREDRDELLASMTDEVGRLVLWDNIMQNELLGTSRFDAPSLVTVHSRVIEDLEVRRGLDRELEALPTEADLRRRKQDGRGLTSPELATLMAHVKLALEAELLGSELPDSDVFAPRLPKYFPEPLREPYKDAITAHPLRRQLVATTLANEAIDCGGITFPYRLTEDSGAAGTDAIRVFAAATEIFGLDEVWNSIRAADVSTAVSAELLLESRRMLDRVSRWLLANRPQPLAVGAEISRYAEQVRALQPSVSTWISGHQATDLDTRSAAAIERGAPVALARRIYGLLDVYCLLDIIDIADIVDRDGAEVAELYFALDAHIGIDWLLSAVSKLARGDRWHSLARLALRDDLYSSLRGITQAVLAGGEPDESVAEKIAEWESTNSSRLARARAALTEIAETGSLDLATLSVAARQVRNMVP